MSIELWAGFAIASLIIGAVPGPGVATIIGFAFSSGRRAALAAVAGMALGNAIAISVSLAGAAAVLATSALAFTVLKWLGALYLIVMGLIAIRRAGAVSDPAPARAIAPGAAFLTTVAVGTFHPKTILFFMSFASQFVEPGAPYLPQAAILVATFTGMAAITDTIYALTASSAAALVRRPGVRRWAQRAGGGVLVAAGVATAAMRRA